MGKPIPITDHTAGAGKISKLATRAYVLALSLIAGLAIIGYGTNYFALQYESSASRIIKLSALQNARFQELVLRVNRLALEENPARAAQSALEIDLLHDIFMATHTNLTLGNDTLNIPPVTDGPLYDLYFGRGYDLDSRVQRASNLILAAIDGGDPADVDELTRFATGDFPALQERVTSQYQHDAEQGMATFAIAQLVLLAALLTSLILVAIFIFHPLVRAVRERTLKLIETQAHIRRSSMTDELTGLANMRGVKAALSDLLAPTRKKGKGIAVMQLDISGFQSINDTLGHDVGDDVLRIVSRRIEGSVRSHDLVGRLGGDDFAILLRDVCDAQDAQTAAEHIMDTLSHPVKINEVTCRIGCYIGIAMCHPGAAPDLPLTNSNIAMCAAQSKGSNGIEIYTPAMRQDLEKREELARELTQALDDGHIRPWFQPQIDSLTGKISGFEALARWEHPEKGVLSPFHFLAIAEQTHQVDRLGEAILAQSLQALQQWDAAGLHVPQVGVNFASAQLQDPRLIEKIKWEVDRHEIDPERIAIEVLETILVEEDDHQIVRNIRGLSELGFSIDLDDFGTGHASISNIRRFAVHRVKIDRSFVSKIDKDESQQQLTAAMISMANSLHVETLAEGVENVEEWSYLAQAGCTHLQGYGIARPMPFHDTIPWLLDYEMRYRSGQAGGAA